MSNSRKILLTLPRKSEYLHRTVCLCVVSYCASIIIPRHKRSVSGTVTPWHHDTMLVTYVKPIYRPVVILFFTDWKLVYFHPWCFGRVHTFEIMLAELMWQKWLFFVCALCCLATDISYWKWCLSIQFSDHAWYLSEPYYTGRSYYITHQDHIKGWR